MSRLSVEHEEAQYVDDRRQRPRRIANKPQGKPLSPEKMLDIEDPPLKLNIGGGDPKSERYVERKGYTLVDRHVGKEAYPLDFSDECADETLASHVLEHFPYEQVQDVVNEWVRVLKPGGLLKIAVPNLAWILERYGKKHPFNLQGFMYGGHRDENDHHKCAFDGDSLKEILANAGLQRIGKWKSDVADCASIEETTPTGKKFSLNYMGYKPHGPVQFLENIRAVLAAPRFGPTMHFRCILNACGALHIYTTIIQGCYWWMQICEAMEEALDEGAEYVLTLDYDSLFSKDDVLELYHLLQTYPEADAVCALQSKRGDETVLIGLSDEDAANVNSMTFAGNITRVATGHFGCTLFRADKLRSLPRPWMMPTPGKDGSWNRDSNAIHPDIQFWHDWAAAKQTLYVANKVVIGHMVEQAMWPGDDFTPVYQGLADYVKTGIPAEVKR